MVVRSYEIFVVCVSLHGIGMLASRRRKQKGVWLFAR
jgi:hypothetical protein